MAGKKPNHTDVAVGQRIRGFRKRVDFSQTELSNQIGVTFQQLQKYENGTNRVGAGRLVLIARALDVPITAFFDGLARPKDKRRKDKSARLVELSRIPIARNLLLAFSTISDPVLQADILNLVRQLGTRRGRK